LYQILEFFPIHIYIFLIILQVNDELALSPGSFTLKHADRKMRKRQSDTERLNTKEFKRQRVERKKTASASASSSETREGVSYRSGVLSTAGSIPDSEMETIPQPPVELHETPLPPHEYSRIYFDLETTGLGMQYTVFVLRD
jgi:uncharacterized protein YprB with RNaseH-like and TPR domain